MSLDQREPERLARSTDRTTAGAAAGAGAEASGEDVVEVHRDGLVSAVLGGLALLMAAAYAWRIAGGGSAPGDVVALLGLIGLVVWQLVTLLDARVPLMVLDDRGVRSRRGRTWTGVAWPEVTGIEHQPRASLLRDGALTIRRTDGDPIGVRLSLGTRLVGADWHELTEALEELSAGHTVVEVVERAPWVQTVEPGADEEPLIQTRDLRPTEALATLPPAEEPVDEEPMDEEPVARESVETDREDGDPAPTRALSFGRRGDVVLPPRPRMRPVASAPTSGPASATASAASPIPSSIPADAEPDATAVVRVADPVIGPALATARAGLRLTVEQVAERTRIRPHIIEAIEVDDFAPCGGDFYARGHLRTLARVLGVDAAPLLARYDERYADAPLDPRCVFEAELSTGTGALRGTRGGVNWSVLVAAVMAGVLVWSVARLVSGAPEPVASPVVLNGSPDQKGSLSSASTGDTVRVQVTAATGGARVEIRDARGRVVFNEDLAFMQTARVDALAPVRIRSTDGGLSVTVGDREHGALGATGQQAERTFAG